MADHEKTPKPARTLTVMPGRWAVCRLDPETPPPAWALHGAFFSITRTPDELSIVCSEADVPAGVRCERGWAGLKVEGPLDFSLTGVLASLAQPLAEAGISLFAVSTYDTDYVLVKGERLERAVAVLAQEGFAVQHDAGLD